MIALKYGSVPIVRETGGLKDTIVPYNLYTDEGNGFSFANYNAHEMLFTIERAVHYWYEDKPLWKRMILRGMHDDFAWGKPAKQYVALYEQLLPPATHAEPQMTDETNEPPAKKEPPVLPADPQAQTARTEAAAQRRRPRRSLP
jgi:hypothetical protein